MGMMHTSNREPWRSHYIIHIKAISMVLATWLVGCDNFVTNDTAHFRYNKYRTNSTMILFLCFFLFMIGVVLVRTRKNSM